MFLLLVFCAGIAALCVRCSSQPLKGKRLTAAGHCRDVPYQGGQKVKCMLAFIERKNMEIEIKWRQEHPYGR